MSIEITPSAVHRSASEVEAAGASLAAALAEQIPAGTPGFQFSDAIEQWNAATAELADKEARDTQALAQKITDSVMVIQRAVDQAAEAARTFGAGVEAS